MKPSSLVGVLLIPMCALALIGRSSTAVAAGSSFPEKGRTITFIVPSAAGGQNDLAARMLAPLLEKELNTTVQVMAKPGAGAQVGSTTLAMAKPDGYTIGYIIFPPSVSAYLDPDRKAVYNRKNFQTLGTHFSAPIVISVAANSPYKSVADIVEAAKAKPRAIKAGATGVLGSAHLAALQLQRATGAKFAMVQFDGGAPALTSLIGGHIDIAFNGQTEVIGFARSGQIRVLANFGKEEIALLPGTKPMEAYGYKLYMLSSTGVCAPAGVSKEVIQVYSEAIKKAVNSKDHQQRLLEMGYAPKFIGPDEYAADWAEYEAEIKPLIEMGKMEDISN